MSANWEHGGGRGTHLVDLVHPGVDLVVALACDSKGLGVCERDLESKGLRLGAFDGLHVAQQYNELGLRRVLMRESASANAESEEQMHVGRMRCGAVACGVRRCWYSPETKSRLTSFLYTASDWSLSTRQRLDHRNDRRPSSSFRFTSPFRTMCDIGGGGMGPIAQKSRALSLPQQKGHPARMSLFVYGNHAMV
ncbi:hypothetical protein BC830DRAFT_573359 [Chytriomyces sp. MP71]|nr:hypothetical protein BC830DRAFT_573359 [Chytriomyces sp. MP71]